MKSKIFLSLSLSLLFFFVNCNEQTLSTDTTSEISNVEQSETASVSVIGYFGNSTSETVTLRNVYKDHVEVEDVSNGGTAEISSNIIEVVTNSSETIELVFNGIMVQSVTTYYNQELNGETVNTTRVTIDDSVVAKGGDEPVVVEAGDPEE